MSSNEIFQIHCEAFSGAKNIESFILTQNNLTELRQCVFDTFLKLKYLNLCGNDILFTDKNLFSGIPTAQLFVKSSDFLVCCFKGNIKCPKQKDTQVLQCSFLQGKILNIVLWVVGSCGLVVNTFCLAVLAGDQTDQKSAFKCLASTLFSSHISFCTFLFLVASIDTYFKDNYAFAKLLWHQTLLCHFLSFVFVFSILECLISNNLMVTARFMIVHFPIKSMFRRLSPVKKLSLEVSSFAFLLSLFCGIEDSGQYFSEGLCLPLDHLGHSTLSMTITIFLAVLGVMSSIF